MTPIKKDATVRPERPDLRFAIGCPDKYLEALESHADTLESRIQELEEARNKHQRGEEIAVRQLEIVKAQAEALWKALEGHSISWRCENGSCAMCAALTTYRTANPDKESKP